MTVKPSPTHLLDVIESLSEITYAEARFHERRSMEVRVSQGKLEQSRINLLSGVSFRVLCDGAWGFSSTAETRKGELKKAFSDAVSVARSSSNAKAQEVRLGKADLAVGTFTTRQRGPLDSHSLEEKVKLVVDTEKGARSYSERVKSAICSYREIIDEKVIVTSDGASAELYDFKPEFAVTAIASEGEKVMTAAESVGVTGGWIDLFEKGSPEEMAKRASEIAVRLLGARQPKGGPATVILDPGMVGLISHEAIGHTVEADFVLAGSVVKGKIGQQVASEMITLVDSGLSERQHSGAGTVLVDDEGVIAQETVVIDKGIMNSYLHNRETAKLFDVASTGNARAFVYSDDPLIRMRNTYIEPGDYDFEEMVREIPQGYYLKGPLGGQADANGEFMFGAQEAYAIEKGEIRELLRGVTISGQAFDALKSVDAVGKDFAFGIGSGYCGKWQLAKVDGGGGHLRCKATIGGIQQ